MIQPAARIRRDSLTWPLRRGRDQCFLHRILGGGKIAVAPSDGAEHLRCELAQQVPDRAFGGLPGHTSDAGACIT
jgi:hypothetical protein